MHKKLNYFRYYYKSLHKVMKVKSKNRFVSFVKMTEIPSFIAKKGMIFFISVRI